eukprot:2996497-Prymnesium_polylepis.2
MLVLASSENDHIHPYDSENRRAVVAPSQRAVRRAAVHTRCSRQHACQSPPPLQLPQSTSALRLHASGRVFPKSRRLTPQGQK